MNDGARGPSFPRRRVLALLGGLLSAPGALAQSTKSPPAGGGVARSAGVAGDGLRITPFAKVVPGYRLRFPRDEGAHPAFRTEWWYITGWLDAATQPLGFQVTFFRARPGLKHDNPSAFSPRQILIGHAALSDPGHGRLVHAQRAARAGFDLAGAERGRASVWLDDWRLAQEGRRYHVRIPAPEFSVELRFDAAQAPLLQGRNGYSRKGPSPESASYYYSIPHLKVGGTVTRGGNTRRVMGAAWMDHEWSSQYLEEEATGWDWIGINLADGGALMAFRMRDRRGGQLWAGGTLRRPDGRTKRYAPPEVRFIPRREWRSPRTGTAYPVSFLVRVGDREYAIEPLFDDQEHDTRASSGTIYWEGAVRALLNGRSAGLGYLELTGYWRRVGL